MKVMMDLLVMGDMVAWMLIVTVALILTIMRQ